MKNLEIKCACVCCPEPDGTVPITLNVICDAKPVTGDVIRYFDADWTVGAKAPVEKLNVEKLKGSTNPSTFQPFNLSTVQPSPTIGLLTDCRMLRLPISLDDAKRMTASELTEAINRAWDLDEKFNPKRAHSRAFGEYVRAREAIRARSLKSNEPQPNQGEGR